MRSRIKLLFNLSFFVFLILFLLVKIGILAAEFNNPSQVSTFSIELIKIRSLVTDNNGNIYVTDELNNKIQMYEVGTTSWVTIGSRGYGVGQFNAPAGISIDNNNIYVSDSGNNRIQKYNIGTSSWTVMGTYGTGPGQFYYPDGIDVDSSGNIYVADTINNRIQKYDIGTTNWTVMGTYGTGPGQFRSPQGVSVDNNDNIYVADKTNDRIQKYDIGTTSWTVMGTLGAGAGQFNYPVGVDVDNNGNIYVVESGNSRVQKYNVGTSSWAVIGTTGTEVGQFGQPYGVNVDSNDNIYVADTLNYRVQKYEIGSNQWSVVVSTSTKPGNVVDPSGLIVTRSGNVYVADSGNNRIQKYDIGTTSWIVMGTYGTGPGQFNYPEGLFVDSSDNIYVADTNNSRIQKYNIGTTSWTVMGTYGTGPGQFIYPKGIAVNSGGNIYVADSGNSRIQKYNIGTSSWTVMGTYGTGPGQFYSPQEIRVDSGDNIYVADTYNNRIQKYDIGTTSWTVMGTYGTGSGQFKHPEGISVDSSGNIYVADGDNDRIQKYDVGTTSWITYGQRGMEYYQFEGPRGIAIGSSDTVYVADTFNNRIQKLIYFQIPGTTTGLAATPGDQQVALTWTAPTTDGGVAISDYFVEFKKSSEDNTMWNSFGHAASTATNLTILGLINGTSYDFRVSAINGADLKGTASTIVMATPTPNLSNLNTKIAIAQALYDIATEGVAHGTYREGSKIQFLGAINAALAVNNTFSQADVNSSVVTLDEAIDEFQSNKIILSEVSEAEIGNLITDGPFVVPVGSSATSTPKLTLANDVVIRIGDTATGSNVFLPEATEITTNNGTSFNANQMIAELVIKSEISNFDSKFNAKASLKWGIMGTTLNFSSPITLNIYVGTEHNGKTLTVQRSPEKTNGWTTDGIVAPGTCVVTDGYCQFQTIKASYFAVLEETVNQSNNQNNSSNNSNNSSPSRVCDKFDPKTNPDLFEIRVDKKYKAKLFYSPVDKSTEYAVLYGFKKGDERFGAIVDTVNNNHGIQSSIIGSLTPGKTYYFKVAASNGCTISDWSEWVPIKVSKNKVVFKYKTIIKNKIKTLVSIFK